MPSVTDLVAKRWTRFLTTGPSPGDLIEADSCRQEGIHQVFRGTVLVMGRPQEIVLLRLLRTVAVEEVAGRPD